MTSRPATSGKHLAERALGAHHFAYLRALAEGVDASDAARRYLGMAHGAEIGGIHRRVVDQARAIARRRGDSRWRLIGLEIIDAPVGTDTADASSAPPIDEWAEREGLDDWSRDELEAMYFERFPHVLAIDESAARRQARNARLRQRRLELLRALAEVATAAASPADLLEGWLPDDLVQQLRSVGDLTLGDLQRRVRRGGRWWGALRAYGPTKAGRLAALLDDILGPPAPADGWPVVATSGARGALAGLGGRNRLQAAGAMDAVDDAAAIARWISARSGSPETSAQYQREAERWVLFCVVERHKAMSDADEADCRAFMDFLEAIPDKWISRRKSKRMAPGWAPFRGQLSVASRRQALTIVGSMMAWLVQSRYLVANPWVLVNVRLGDDAQHDDDVTSRAFTPAAWRVLMDSLQEAPASASTARLRWICVFGHAVGLRAAELIAATRGQLTQRPGGWTIRVLGKGRRSRTVPVPAVAMKATRAYFEARSLDFDDAPAGTPLLCSLVSEEAITYAALNQTFTRFVRRAIEASNLPASEKATALRASAHWLRHTYGTRAAEAGVPPDVLQENFGHADPRTSSLYYRAQLERRQRAVEGVFADDETTAPR